MIGKCNDPDCSGYGKQDVDRGYGFPVCPSQKPSLHPKKMNPVFEGHYNKEL